ncbi:MAG: hypothetical protein Roseis2KO_41440 [Roseivirga sp.]
MTRTIIGVWGKANTGKTTTLALLGHQLISAGATTGNNINHTDYQAIFQYKSATVGLQTYGDYAKVVREGLLYLGTQCDVLVMATRSLGYSVKELQDYAKRHGYRLIWATPLQLEGAQPKGSAAVRSLKDYSAEQLLKMVDDIIAGIL